MPPFLFNLFLVVLLIVKSECVTPPSSAMLLPALNLTEDNSHYVTLNYSTYFKACFKSDPSLDECIEDNIREGGPSFAKGIPELGIKPLDPVKLGIIKLNNPTLKLTFSNAELSGLSKFQLNSFNMNLDSNKAMLDFTANVTLKAHYLMDGQVLLLPVKGDGKAKVKITNLNIKLNYKYEIRDGHWRIVEYKDTHTMDKASFKFTNMFGGHNMELAKTFHLIINEHWQVVMDEIAPEITKHIINICVETVKQFYAGVPASELLKA